MVGGNDARADGTARVWDAQDGHLLFTLTARSVAMPSLAILWGRASALLSACFSPDGSRIVTAGADGTARVWDALDGRALGMLTGHTSAVNSAVFSSDSTRIVTASEDRTARIYAVNFDQLLARAKRLLPVESGN